MTEFYTVKQIDNSRVLRSTAPQRLREYCRLVALGGVLAGVALLYAWQHFQCIQLSYQLEELKAERAQAADLNQQLKLEAAGLRSPMRIDAIARNQLGLNVPVPGQVAPVEGPSEAVLAQARTAAHPRSE
jgi:cell division protein FtsL